MSAPKLRKSDLKTITPFRNANIRASLFSGSASRALRIAASAARTALWASGCRDGVVSSSSTVDAPPQTCVIEAGALCRKGIYCSLRPGGGTSGYPLESKPPISRSGAFSLFERRGHTDVGRVLDRGEGIDAEGYTWRRLRYACGRRLAAPLGRCAGGFDLGSQSAPDDVFEAAEPITQHKQAQFSLDAVGVHGAPLVFAAVDEPRQRARALNQPAGIIHRHVSQECNSASRRNYAAITMNANVYCRGLASVPNAVHGDAQSRKDRDVALPGA